MSVWLGLRLPHIGRDAISTDKVFVELENYKDVELVPFSHASKSGYDIGTNINCEGHLLALAEILVISFSRFLVQRQI